MFVYFYEIALETKKKFSEVSCAIADSAIARLIVKVQLVNRDDGTYLLQVNLAALFCAPSNFAVYGNQHMTPLSIIDRTSNVYAISLVSAEACALVQPDCTFCSSV